MHKLADFCPDTLTIKDVATDADADPDPVSFHWLCVEDSKPHDLASAPEVGAGCLVFVKGLDNAKALAAWLEERGLLTR